jgi:hypothetical protein
VRLEVLSTWSAETIECFARQLKNDEIHVGTSYPRRGIIAP